MIKNTRSSERMLGKRGGRVKNGRKENKNTSQDLVKSSLPSGILAQPSFVVAMMV